MEENLHLHSVKLAYGLGFNILEGEMAETWSCVSIPYCISQHFSRETEPIGCVYVCIVYICVCRYILAYTTTEADKSQDL